MEKFLADWRPFKKHAKTVGVLFLLKYYIDTGNLQ